MKKLYSCHVFGEGGKDKKFLMELIDLDKFRYHARYWEFTYGCASGGSAEAILDQCYKETRGVEYDLIICFIDLDDFNFKNVVSKNWEKEKKKIELKYLDDTIKVVWQIDNLEDEFRKVFGEKHKSKGMINNMAKKNIQKFINSPFYKRILKIIKDREHEIKNIK